MNSEENEAQKLPDGWILCQSKSNPGRRYFFNTKTGKSSWTQPQADDESDQKKQKGKKDKSTIREKKKKTETQMKILKRKSDGEEDSLANKKQKPESTPEEQTPSPSKPATPAKYTEPKPIEKEPCLKPILTKNMANTRLSQLRARLSSEAQASLSRDEVESPDTSLRIPRTPAPFTEQKSVRFDLKSPPLNEFKSTTRTPSCESLQSASPSQFLAATKIISSMKAHLSDQFKNMRPKDAFADIEEGICSQTAEHPFMKHPTTPPQFSEASKLVSAIKSKLSYTPMDYRVDRARSFMSNREYVDKIKSFISAKEQNRYKNEKIASTPCLNQDQINHNNIETRAIMQPKPFAGNRENQMRTLVPNRDHINCRNEKPVTCTPHIRATDPRQDKLRTFISNVRHLNDIENNKQHTRLQEHINFNEYKARNSMPNRNNIDQTNRLGETVKNYVSNRQNIEDNPKIQIPSTSIGDNGRISSIKSIEHNARSPISNRQGIDSDTTNHVSNKRDILIDTRTPIPGQKSIEGDKQNPITNRRSIETDVRIPMSNRLNVDMRQGLCSANRQNIEETVKIETSKEQLKEKTRIPYETAKVSIQSRLKIAESSAIHMTEQTEERLSNHLPNQDQLESRLNSIENSSEPLNNNIVLVQEEVTSYQSKEQIEKDLATPSPNEDTDEESEIENEEPNEDSMMISIEEELEKMDQKSPQNQNIVNHRKEEDSLELSIKPNTVIDTQNQELENHTTEKVPTVECTDIELPSPHTQSLAVVNHEVKFIEPPVAVIEHPKESNFMSDESIISLLSDDSTDSKVTDDKSDVEVEKFASAKDRMDSLRNRLSKEAEELTEITDVEFLNSIKLPSPNVITDEEYLNMIELPKCSSEAMEVDCKEDLESTSNSYPKIAMDPNADIVLVVDTNIFIHELDIIRNVLNSHIKGYTEQPTLLVPWRVITELDRLKDNNNGNGSSWKRARTAMDYLYKSLPENDRIKGQSLRDSNAHIYPCESPDDEILNCCLQQAERGKSVILLSNDKNLCNKATINGVRCIPLDQLRMLLEIKTQDSPDPDICATVKHCEAVMYSLLANILENEMRAKYNNLWQHIIFKPPPWSLIEVLQCILKHWIAVFNEVFPRIEHLITDLKNTVNCIEMKNPASLTQSEVASFKELCLEIATKCLIIPEYMVLAKATMERLHRKPNENTMPELAVIDAFERLWTVFSSYCAQLCSAVGLECNLEDKMGGAYTARQLGERWPVYSAQLYALTLAIKGSLCMTDDELTEEQVDELEDVFKECLALVETDGSKINKDNIRVFCTKCRNMLQEASAKFCGLTEILNVCKQRMETM